MRYFLAIFLLGVGTFVTGCSGGYYVDPADFRAKGPAVSGRAVAPARATVRTANRSQSGATSTSHSNASEMNGREMNGTTGRSSDQIKPWPKRGTAESDLLQAEEADRERRIGRLLRDGICRGC
jgi:hypothetical protein